MYMCMLLGRHSCLPTIPQEEGEMREAVAVNEDWQTQAQECYKAPRRFAIIQRGCEGASYLIDK